MIMPKVVFAERQKCRRSINLSTANWRQYFSHTSRRFVDIWCDFCCCCYSRWNYLTLIWVVLTMCFGSAVGCRGGTLIRTGITPDEKLQILETHNRLRSSVAQGRVPNQPGAENMQEMVWDDELAQKAQQWANQCTFQHDPSRYLNRFTMGQNLAIIWSTIPLADDDGDFPSRIQNWFNEVQKYAWGAQWSPTTGHYSQLVWGDTNLIGCGFSYYKDARRYNKLWVCNYGPGGNVEGSVPYEVGRPSCITHGMVPSKRYTGLCQSYSSTSAVAYNPNNNFIRQSTYTFKTERFNPPTYQVQDKIKNVFNQVLTPSQSTNFKTDYALKSVFDKIQSAEPQTSYHLQTSTFNFQPSQPALQNSFQPTYEQPYQQTYELHVEQPSYEQQPFLTNADQPNYQQPNTVYEETTQQSNQQSYQQPCEPSTQQPVQQPYQTYQPPDVNNLYQQSYKQPVQTSYQQTYEQPAPSYNQPSVKQSYEQQSKLSYNQQAKYQKQTYQQQQPQQPAKQKTLEEIRRAAFLTYDWSQLFNTNFKFRNKK